VLCNTPLKVLLLVTPTIFLSHEFQLSLSLSPPLSLSMNIAPPHKTPPPKPTTPEEVLANWEHIAPYIQCQPCAQTGTFTRSPGNKTKDKLICRSEKCTGRILAPIVLQHLNQKNTFPQSSVFQWQMHSNKNQNEHAPSRSGIHPFHVDKQPKGRYSTHPSREWRPRTHCSNPKSRPYYFRCGGWSPPYSRIATTNQH